MPIQPEPDPFALDAYDEIIDARSPGEFAEDRLPGAVNLPVLDDAERARVGAIYVRESTFLARKVGAALAARNIARHLETHFAAKPGGYRPLVHCWRGGQRSRSMASVLSEIGWRVGLLDGGYKTYRRAVSARLYETEPWFDALLIDGLTGVGKTEILGRVAALGGRVVDLEAAAAHRGSIFGFDPDAAQPSQKLFESRVLAALPPPCAAAARPLVAFEAESAKIGERATPPSVWKAMQTAPRIEIVAPLAARAAYLAREYAFLAEDPARLDALLVKLTPLRGAALVEEWRALARARRAEALVAGLLERHYDPAYRRMGARGGEAIATIRLERVDENAFDAAARQILAAHPALAPP